jgi:glycosyltransferase involved in cell wall biosynthesis
MRKRTKSTYPTVTVAIPAYNEGKRILPMLASVLKQKAIGYKLEKILIASDGSNDDTVKKARSMKDKRIEIIDDPKRRGRTYRLNQTMKISSTDILLYLDADLIIQDEFLIKKMIEPFISDLEVTLVGGNPHSIGEKSFLGSSLEATRNIYIDIRKSINNGSNIFGCMGGVLALSKLLYKNLHIPNNITADDSFIYLSNKRLKHKFVHVFDAEVLHPLPDNTKKHLLRVKRYSSAKNELISHFGKDIIEREYSIPKFVYFKSTFKQFLKQPAHILFIFVINKVGSVLANKLFNKQSGFMLYAK